MSVRGESQGFWRSARRLPSGLPLSAKLITAVLALVAVALVLISLFGIGLLRSNLLGQADSQLAAAAYQVRTQIGTMNPYGPPLSQNGEAAIWVPNHGQPEVLITPTSASGLQPGGPGIPLPAIPSDVRSLPQNASQAVTVGSASGSGLWRVIGLPGNVRHPDGSVTFGVVIVATDATSAYHTISTLTGIDLLVSLVVLVALAAVGTAVVRVSIRPLTDIEQTAGAIAAGELSRRVPELDPRTEIGRLGRSLNAMLTQIELAFRARASSETAARRSEERMRQFVADASHELRTPLTAIRGFAEYYRQRGGISAASPADPASAPGQPGARNGSLSREDLDRIMRRVEQESARMGVLVEDMLLLARLDQQRPLDRKPVDLLTLAADAVHDARVVAPGRSINLTVGTGAALLVLGDEVRLRQVIGNLMSNALLHTPDRTPIDVRIRSGTLEEAAGPGAAGPASPGSAGPGPANPGYPAADPAGLTAHPSTAHPAVVLEVADQGPGLSQGQAAHVFERFYRADQARTAGGTGLGLAIVAALVAAHGGTVWVDSAPGGGAIFRIALPLAPEAIGHDAEPSDLDLPDGPDVASARDAQPLPSAMPPDILESRSGQDRR